LNLNNTTSTNSLNPVKSNTEKAAEFSSRNKKYQEGDYKQPSNNNQVVNTSPDASVNKSNKGSVSYLDLDNNNKENKKETSSLQFVNINNQNNLRKSSVSPFGHKIALENKKQMFGLNNSRDFLVKKKVFQSNLLVQSKDDKFSNLSINNHNNILSASINRHKTPENRLFNRDYSAHNLFYKNKSKSINRDRNTNGVSQERGKKNTLMESVSKSNRQMNLLNSKIKFSPTHNLSSKGDLNINVNMPNSNHMNINPVSTGKNNNKKTPKNSINIVQVQPVSSCLHQNISTNSVDVAIKNKDQITTANSGSAGNTGTGITGASINKISTVSILSGNNTNSNLNTNLNSNPNSAVLSSFIRPIDNKAKTKEGASNPKFIKKDATRPKSATGIRTINGISYYKK